MHVFHYCGATGIDLRRAPIMGTRTFGTQTTDPGTYANTFRVKHIRQSDSDLGDGYLTFPSYIDFSGDTDSRHTYSMFRHSRGVETIEFTNWKPSCITGWFGGCINLKTFKSKGMECDWTYICNTFENCWSMESCVFEKGTTTQLGNRMDGMFRYCYNVKYIDLSGIDLYIDGCVHDRPWFTRCDKLVSTTYVDSDGVQHYADGNTMLDDPGEIILGNYYFTDGFFSWQRVTDNYPVNAAVVPEYIMAANTAITVKNPVDASHLVTCLNVNVGGREYRYAGALAGFAYLNVPADNRSVWQSRNYFGGRAAETAETLEIVLLPMCNGALKVTHYTSMQLSLMMMRFYEFQLASLE